MSEWLLARIARPARVRVWRVWSQREFGARAAALLILLLVVLMLPATAGAATTFRMATVRSFAAKAVDPAYPVQALDALAVARDGTGGLAYMASINGVDHLFVMRLSGGALSSAVELDSALGGTSSQPVVAAAPGGRLVVAFVNSGNLYVSEAASAADQLSAPVQLATAASNPSVSLNRLGQGYLAFTQKVGARNDVEVYFWGGSHWHLARPEPFNVTPQDDAGTGTGRPVVVAANDGVGLVAWGENGHVYSRRVWNTMTSVETEQLDPATYADAGGGGSSATTWTWQQSGNPAVATDGNSTYMDVAFTETMTDGLTTISRVFVRRLVAQTLRPAKAVDGLTALSTNGGLSPRIVMDETGYGLVTDASVNDGSVIGTPLGSAGSVLQPFQIGPSDAVGPDAIPVAEGSTRTMTVWVEPYMGDSSNPQVVEAYSSYPNAFAATTAISSPGDGPVDFANGLLAGGDGAGDGVIVWLQGTPGAETVHIGGVLVPPGKPFPHRRTTATTKVRPLLRWRRAREHFGSVSYTVKVAGRPVARTTHRTLRLPTTLRRGTYRWRVTATNQVGESTTSSAGILTVKRYRRHRHRHRSKKHGRTSVSHS